VDIVIEFDDRDAKLVGLLIFQNINEERQVEARDQFRTWDAT
jgi:hypothetical protein